MKKLLLILVILVLSLSLPMAMATATANGVTYSEISPFKFEHKKTGIDCGSCPVYSAPSTEAYRAANGKASVATNSSLDIGGFNETGWLLVRYETKKDCWRVGWIPPKYVKSVKTSMTPHFVAIDQVAETEINVSDNNLDIRNPSSWFAKLEAGEQYTIVGRYNYYGVEQYYIEFYLNGQIARGFIPAY